jgi:hypothetical protein
MTKKTILLFVRALVIGVLVNLGIYYVSLPTGPEQEVGLTQPILQNTGTLP